MRTVLVANRGEIAVRVIRACRELGLRTVAVYSEADADALHTCLADDRVLLGAAGPAESYLHIGRLIDAARKTGADAVHPGYGFLSESAEFAAAVRDAGLVWIGPSSEVIARLGDKRAARRLAETAGVPGVPGCAEADASDEALVEAARRLGFPVMIKAAAGGGGRGMRLVECAEDLRGALEVAHREAEAAFGSGALLLERYLPEVRHIEMQVLADQHGAVLALGERECSIQRRHQKIVEESPSPFVTPALRSDLAAAARGVAQAAGYINAGTVEFLVDADARFYFLEVNTRLQVEHPVTEATLGIDLVKAQIRIAAGAPLRFGRAEPRGHAIECRVYAEDPAHDFRPSPGPILMLREPVGPGIRVDSGLREGWRVPVAYDPLLAKVIAWDRTREDAIDRMAEALRRYVILGCRTNLDFLQDIVGSDAFARGETTTRFLERYFSRWTVSVAPPALAAAGVIEVMRETRREAGPVEAREAPHRGTPAAGRRADNRAARVAADAVDPWETIGPWRMGATRG
jgi:acetyl-CoA carboxylase biotin carboxylase subunit